MIPNFNSNGVRKFFSYLLVLGRIERPEGLAYSPFITRWSLPTYTFKNIVYNIWPQQDWSSIGVIIYFLCQSLFVSPLVFGLTIIHFFYAVYWRLLYIYWYLPQYYYIQPEHSKARSCTRPSSVRQWWKLLKRFGHEAKRNFISACCRSFFVYIFSLYRVASPPQQPFAASPIHPLHPVPSTHHPARPIAIFDRRTRTRGMRSTRT